MVYLFSPTKPSFDLLLIAMRTASTLSKFFVLVSVARIGSSLEIDDVEAGPYERSVHAPNRQTTCQHERDRIEIASAVTSLRQSVFAPFKEARSLESQKRVSSIRSLEAH